MSIARIALALLVLTACGQNGQTPPPSPAMDRKEELIDENKRWAEREARDIDLWVRRQGVPFNRSGTGLRWRLVRDVPGDTARPEQLARVHYRLGLLSGDTCYTTEPGRPEDFRVEHDDVESGLHEAIQHLSVGDSAVVVIPSHRAHGLVGDQNKVPMRSPVIYYIGLDRLTDPRR
jgi:FKBP-type peptidyl-prolyl cis-trans isomerase